MKNKKYLFVNNVTRDCKINWRQNLVYSYLVYRRVFNAAATGNDIRKFLPVHWQTLKQDIDCLISHQLVSIQNGKYLANEPEGETIGWFHWKDQDNLEWCKKFASFKVFIPKSQKTLPLLHSVVLGMISNLPEDWKIRRGGLATQILPTHSHADGKREISRIFDSLEAKGVLEITDSRESFIDWLHSIEYTLTKAGYSKPQMVELFHEVFDLSEQICESMEVFVRYFPSYYRYAENTTSINRQNKGWLGNSLGLLRIICKGEMLRINDYILGQGLRYYEPSEKLKIAV